MASGVNTRSAIAEASTLFGDIVSHECKALLVNKVGSAWSPLGALESVVALDHQLIDHEAQTLKGTLEIFIREATGRLLSFESAPDRTPTAPKAKPPHGACDSVFTCTFYSPTAIWL